jgi:hypothetical protein
VWQTHLEVVRHFDDGSDVVLGLDVQVADEQDQREVVLLVDKVVRDVERAVLAQDPVHGRAPLQRGRTCTRATVDP